MAIELKAPPDSPAQADSEVVPAESTDGDVKTEWLSTDADGAVQVDKEVWIYPPSDQQGFSHLYQCRGMPQLHNFFEAVIYQRRFPYRPYNESDIVRHALHRHMAYLMGHPGCPKAAGTVMNSMMRIIEQEETNQQFGQAMERTQRLVTHAMTNNNPAAAEDLVRGLWNTLKGMERTPWREQYMRQFRVKFGHLLKE